MKSKILVAILLIAVCCPIFAIHQTYYYDVSALSFRSITNESGTFEQIVWPNSYCDMYEIGKPELPIFHHNIKLSETTAVDSVKIVLAQGISGTLSAPVLPVQRPIPTGVSSNQEFSWNDDVYRSNMIMPADSLHNYQIENSREGTFLSLDIVPFHYNPVTNGYTAYSVAEVEIFTHEIREARINGGTRDIGIPYYEYVIITTAPLISAFEPFAQWKRAKGYNVGIVDINDILNNAYLTNGDTISNIVDNAGKLRQYLIYSYHSAHTKYVLLGGDATQIPIRYACGIEDSIPSDFYYSELDCNWDMNNNGKFGEFSDLVDYGAEVYVGRLLCSTENEVKNWTSKVLQYEINPGNGDFTYLGRALFTQSDHMQQGEKAESIQQKLQGYIDCTILNEYPSYNDFQPSLPLGANVISLINNTHYGLLGNFNHGGPLSFGIATRETGTNEHDVDHGIVAMDGYDSHDEWLYSTINDIGNGFDNLTNRLFPSIVYSISCTNMPFDSHETPVGTNNLGKVFTCISKGGGPAYLGNTRTGYVTASTNLYKRFLDSILVNVHINHLGIAEAKSKFLQQNNHLRHSHNLLGCPEMSLYTHVPNVFDNVAVDTTNNKLTVSIGTDSVESRICLSGYVDGNYKQFIYENRSIVFFDTIPEPYTLVVSKPNYIPYILTYHTCFLQNTTITDDRMYDGCSTFDIGSDISSLQPFGNVVIEDGGDVVIYRGNNVLIKNNFEVKLGGKFEIR